ncbi:hypothetical protein V6N13_033687 [Hibiscus sabdariffa]
MLFKRASKYGPWLRAEIKGRKKYGKFLPNEQLQSDHKHNNGDVAKVNEKVKEDEPKSESFQGISPIIIPISKEDQTSTMGKSNGFNDSDSHILAGKNKGDDPSPLVTAMEKERTFHSDNCIKDKIVYNDGEDCNPYTAGKPSILGSLICNNFEQIRVTNKKKRDEQEDEADFELLSCAKRKALHVAINKDILQIGPGNWSDSGNGEEDEDPVEPDDLAEVHPHDE